MISPDYILNRFGKLDIIVIGDVMLDRYWCGSVSRLSPEAPSIVIDLGKNRVENRPGGAANVARNLRSLGANTSLIGVIGRVDKDHDAEELRRCVESNGINFMWFEDDRGTIVKERFISDEHNIQIFRADYEGDERREPISQNLVDDIAREVESKMPVNAIFLSDYNKGMFKSGLAKKIIEITRKYKVIAASGPKPSNITEFSGSTLVCMNNREAYKITGVKYKDMDSLEAIGKSLKEKANPEHVVVTLGKDGMFIYDGNGNHTLMSPKIRKDVRDVTGAGDTSLAVLGLSLAAGYDIRESAEIANAAAGIVVEKVGTSALTLDELIERIK